MTRPPIATRMHHPHLDARTLSSRVTGAQADLNGIAE
jgi:hypothetical protein